MRALIYCRVSSVEQAENLSLLTQEEACRSYCARQGYDVAEVFVDPGESAKTTQRPEFLRMLSACRERRGSIQAVVVYALTRFSRNQHDHHAIATLLRGLGIALRSATEPIDESPSGKLLEGVLAAVAQFDNDVRGERSKAGLRAAVKQGRWVWMAPIGYRTGSPRQGEPSLVPDPDRAPLIRQAFELVATGRATGRKLARQLHGLGLRTKRGARVSKSALYTLLKNPIYKGEIVAKTNPEPQPGDFEPIVTAALFAKVQHALSGRGPMKGATQHRNHPDFPLRRFISCAVCQGKLTGGWSAGRTQRYAYYRCQRGCTRITREHLDEAFTAQLNALKPDPGRLRLFQQHFVEALRTDRQAAAAARQRLQRQIDERSGKLAALDDAYLFQHTIDLRTYQRLRDELREQVALLEMELADTATTMRDLEGQMAFTIDALGEASQFWTGAGDVDERIRVQWIFFPEGLAWQPAEAAVQSRRNGEARGGFIEPRNVLRFFQLEGIFRRNERGGVDDGN